MRFIKKVPVPYELAYNDVFLIPNKSNIKSRMDVDITPTDGMGGTIPVIATNMSAVAGKRMAETTARRGAFTIFTQDVPVAEIKKMVDYVKSRHLIYETPISLSPEDRVQDVQNLIHKRAHGAVIIVDKKNKPIGIIKLADVANKDRFTRLSQVMRSELITLSDKLSCEEMYYELLKNRVSIAPVVNRSGVMLGVMSQKGAVRSRFHKPALDNKGRLLTAATIGINQDITAKTKAFMKMGVDVIKIDTAHGHQQKMIDAIKEVRTLSDNIKIAAGTVVTAKATKDLIKAGANVVKVGIGAGAMCTTRMMTGVGRPQLSAVIECSKSARELGGSIWADGGIRTPRDVAVAMAAGAGNTLFGSWWAGTNESSADVQVDSNGRMYKVHYGMASSRAVFERTKHLSPYDRAIKEMFKEGISSSKYYINPEYPSAEDIIDQIAAGLRSAMSYTGAKNLEEFYDKAVMGIQSMSGFTEGKSIPKSWV